MLHESQKVPSAVWTGVNYPTKKQDPGLLAELFLKQGFRVDWGSRKAWLGAADRKGWRCKMAARTASIPAAQQPSPGIPAQNCFSRRWWLGGLLLSCCCRVRRVNERATLHSVCPT